MNFSFDVSGTGVSPYGIFLALSFLVSFTVACVLMLKRGVHKMLVFGSAVINFILALYFGCMFTVVANKGLTGQIGFTSMGGLAGVLLGTFVLGLVFKEYKTELWRAYATVIPLVYSISKLGCFSVGCCHGIRYNGPLSVTYHGALPPTTEVELFPVQLAETVVFFVIFLAGVYSNYARNSKNGILTVLIMCSVGKFGLDFLRQSHVGVVLSTNQILCIVVFLGAIIIRLRGAFRKGGYEQEG